MSFGQQYVNRRDSWPVPAQGLEVLRVSGGLCVLGQERLFPKVAATSPPPWNETHGARLSPPCGEGSTPAEPTHHRMACKCRSKNM